MMEADRVVGSGVQRTKYEEVGWAYREHDRAEVWPADVGDGGDAEVERIDGERESEEWTGGTSGTTASWTLKAVWSRLMRMTRWRSVGSEPDES